MSDTKKITCADIAKAVRDLMGMAIFSGFVNQVEGEGFRQFKVTSIDENMESAVMLLNIGEQKFKLTVSSDTDN